MLISNTHTLPPETAEISSLAWTPLASNRCQLSLRRSDGSTVNFLGFKNAVRSAALATMADWAFGCCAGGCAAHTFKAYKLLVVLPLCCNAWVDLAECTRPNGMCWCCSPSLIGCVFGASMLAVAHGMARRMGMGHTKMLQDTSVDTVATASVETVALLQWHSSILYGMCV